MWWLFFFSPRSVLRALLASGISQQRKIAKFVMTSPDKFIEFSKVVFHVVCNFFAFQFIWPWLAVSSSSRHLEMTRPKIVSTTQIKLFITKIIFPFPRLYPATAVVIQRIQWTAFLRLHRHIYFLYARTKWSKQDRQEESEKSNKSHVNT